MGTEIERKFLVRDSSWQTASGGDNIAIRQFYLGRRDDFSVRVRIVDETDAFLTIKTGSGFARGEFEYPIPLQDALDLEPARIGISIAKRRHRLPHGDHLIEIDVFEGDLAPLVVAEIELETEMDAVELPAFLGREVTGDPAYSNVRLAVAGLPESDFTI
jgi:adenylate cyclase